MATITRQDIDALNVGLTVTVSKDDYSDDLQKELKRYRQQAQLKGFRKGKIPMSVVRKMFGRDILANTVNRQLQDDMSKFLYDKENKLDFLGQPIPADDQENIEFNLSDLKDYVFKFELGLAPVFDLKGVEEGGEFDLLVVEPGKEQLEEEFMNMRRRFGESEEVEEAVNERDIITLQAVELLDGVAKEGGVENEFTLFVQNTTASAKEAFVGKNKGDKIVHDVFSLEEKSTEDHVRKYLLGLDEADAREVGNVFDLTITKVSRHVPAEVNAEFYEKAFPEGDVSSEEEALTKVKKDISKYFASQADALLFRDLQEHLMAQNVLEFPETFLKRWLVFSNEKNTTESVEQGFEGFCKGLQWTLIREKLIKTLELEVTQDEIRASFGEQVKGYFGGAQPEWLNDDMIKGMVDRMMNEEKSVREKFDELMNEKISVTLKEKYTLKDKGVTPEEFQAIIAEVQAKNEAESRLLGDEEEE